MPLIPKLQDRRLRICPNEPGLCYDYEVCVKKILGFCTKKEWKHDFFDLNDKEVRSTLIDNGFTATSDRRWK